MFKEQGGDYVARQALKFFGDIPRDAVEYEWCLSKKMNKKKQKLVTKCNILKLVFNYGRVNCLSPQLIECINKLVIKFDKHSYVRGFILTSNFSNFIESKRHVFCAGLDLRTIKKFSNNSNADKLNSYLINVGEAFGLFDKIRKPIVCGINGDAIAGGCLVALGCDFRIMSSNGRIGMNESTFGQIIGEALFKRIAYVTGKRNATYIGQTGLYLKINKNTFWFNYPCTKIFFCCFGFLFCVVVGLLFDSKDALKLRLIDQECIYEPNESDLKNEQKLLTACCDVLSNKYFNGELNAAAMVKYLARKEIIETSNNKSQSKQNIEKAARLFQTPTMEKYMKSIMTNKSRSKL